MKNEFTLAFNEVLEDKQLPRPVVMEALEAAMISAYRKAVNASTAQQVVAKIDPDDGRVLIYAEKEVVDTVHDQRTEVALEDAKKVDPEAEIGEMVIVETTPRNFGRVAAQTARQVIQQRMREAERDAQFNHFSALAGEIVNGVVQAVNASHLTIGMDKKAEGLMPRKEQITGERFRVHDRVRALLLEVKQSPRGPQITLSRAHRDFLRRLLEDEVPEIYHGMVEIRSIAREPGQRSKVAVSALQAGIDPVGACVGVRGVRIQAIVRELNEEKIDVIEWNADPSEFIAKALSPARVVGVFLDKHAKAAKTATVVVPEDQLSLAIGRDGQNARLAAKLTGWRIDIKSLPEAATDAVYNLQQDEAYAFVAEAEADVLTQVELILEKKAEGRPITPEEYQVLSRFVVRTERMIAEQREAEKQAERELRDEIRSRIPDVAFETPLDELGIPPRFVVLLGGEGYSTIGDLMFQFEMDPDVILALNGMGPKTMADVEEAIRVYVENLPAPEEIVEVEETVEEEIEAPEAAVAAETDEEAELQVAVSVEDGAEADAQAEAVVEPSVEVEDGEVEPLAEPVAELETQPAVEEDAVQEQESAEEAEEGIEEFFELDDEILGLAEAGFVDEDEEADEDEDDEQSDQSKRGNKRKKRFVEMEYDPDRDVMLVKRKRKRGGDEDWLEDDWDY